MFFRCAFFRLRANKLARSILLCMGLLDELLTGFPIVALPLLRERLGLSYAQAGLLFTAAALSGMLIDPFINLLSDHGSKKPWVLGGLMLLALTSVLMCAVASYPLLMLTFIVWFPANGAAIGLAQAALIDFSPATGTRLMTRWTLLSSVGDFLSPLVVAAFVGIGLGWTALCCLACALWLLAVVMLLPLRFPARNVALDEDEGAEGLGVWASLREALRDPLLLRWSALTIIPTMLDEIFLGFVSLYLHDVLHLSEALVALLVTLQMVASFLGLFLLDRVLKRRQLAPVRALFWFSLVALVGVAGLLLFHALWLVIAALLVISFCAASWYPLAQAEAYARRPTSSGVVRVVISLGAPFDMLLPGAVGLISAHFGILAGLGILGLAPVLMLLLLPYRQFHQHAEERS